MLLDWAKATAAIGTVRMAEERILMVEWVYARKCKEVLKAECW